MDELCSLFVHFVLKFLYYPKDIMMKIETLKCPILPSRQALLILSCAAGATA